MIHLPKIKISTIISPTLPKSLFLPQWPLLLPSELIHICRHHCYQCHHFWLHLATIIKVSTCYWSHHSFFMLTEPSPSQFLLLLPLKSYPSSIYLFIHLPFTFVDTKIQYVIIVLKCSISVTEASSIPNRSGDIFCCWFLDVVTKCSGDGSCKKVGYYYCICSLKLYFV